VTIREVDGLYLYQYWAGTHQGVFIFQFCDVAEVAIIHKMIMCPSENSGKNIASALHSS